MIIAIIHYSNCHWHKVTANGTQDGTVYVMAALPSYMFEVSAALPTPVATALSADEDGPAHACSRPHHLHTLQQT